VGHAKNQIHDFLALTWPPLFASWFRVACGLDKFSVPSKDRVGRDLFKVFSAESLTFHCQDAALIIGKQNAFASQLLAKYLVLHLEVFDDQFLLLAYVLDKYGNKQMQRLE